MANMASLHLPPSPTILTSTPGTLILHRLSYRGGVSVKGFEFIRGCPAFEVMEEIDGTCLDPAAGSDPRLPWSLSSRPEGGFER